MLSKNLNLSEDFDTEVSEPYKIYRGLTVKEMEELRVDIKMHLELDRATKFPKVSVFACEVSVFSPHLKSIDSPLTSEMFKMNSLARSIGRSEFSSW